MTWNRPGASVLKAARGSFYDFTPRFNFYFCPLTPADEKPFLPASLILLFVSTALAQAPVELSAPQRVVEGLSWDRRKYEALQLDLTRLSSLRPQTGAELEAATAF